MSDPVAEALRAAHVEASSFYTVEDTARIVAAFLHRFGEALKHRNLNSVEAGFAAWLAAAVERAAKGERG